jgi:hypothetical protein
MKIPYYLRLFEFEPKTFKGIRERSAHTPTTELALNGAGPPITREEALAALKRSRARRAAKGLL